MTREPIDDLDRLMLIEAVMRAMLEPDVPKYRWERALLLVTKLQGTDTRVFVEKP
jgi:hypothetical protein